MTFTFLVTSLGYCWQYGEVQVKSAYVYRSEEEISGTLGIFVGLRRINITLTGTQSILLSIDYAYAHTSKTCKISNKPKKVLKTLNSEI